MLKLAQHNEEKAVKNHIKDCVSSSFSKVRVILTNYQSASSFTMLLEMQNNTM